VRSTSDMVTDDLRIQCRGKDPVVIRRRRRSSPTYIHIEVYVIVVRILPLVTKWKNEQMFIVK
jgi:hypothetical protein